MPKPRVESCGPFLGMRMGWQTPFDPKYAYMAVNMLPRVRGVPSQYLTVPWPLPTFLGGTAFRALQALAVLQVVNPVNVVVQAGELYTESGVTWTRQVTQANLATAGITFSTLALPVYAVPFNGLLLFSDGINTPFTWNGTAGAGGLVKLTNAPVFYGRPTVYYGKVMGIKDAQRDTFVWSEENNANLGYEAGGFNNAWSLTQTGGGALYALLGCNEGLYYWRADRTGIIRGAVTPDFRASGVHDDVSTSVGVTNSEAVCFAGERVWFGDPQGRPYVVSNGVAKPVWSQIVDAFGLGAGDSTPVFGGLEPTSAEMIAVPHEGLVMLHWPNIGFVVFDSEAERALMLWVPPRVDFTGGEPRIGPLWAAGKLQVGIGYHFGNPDFSVGAHVDHWPPYGADNLYPTWVDDSITGEGVSPLAYGVLVAGPFGGDPDVVTAWTEATVSSYTPRSEGLPLSLALYANTTEAYQPPAAGIGVPANLTVVGPAAGQLLSPNNQRQNRRLPWGLRRELRQLWLCVAGFKEATNPRPWGVESIKAKGQPFLAGPSKT